MSESAGEKSFAPSAKRLRDAAGKGDVLRSRELATASAVLIGALWLKFAGPWVLEGLGTILRSGFSWRRAALVDFDPARLLLPLVRVALPPVLLLGASIMLAALVSQLGFGQGRFVASNLSPRASRLNPLAGLARIFGPNGWIELGKGLAKLILLGAVAYGWSRGRLAELLALGGSGLSGQLAYGWQALTSLLFALSIGLLLIALIDVPIAWVRRNRRLRMTLQELRDEHKEADGSPANKAAIRSRQRKLAMGGVASAMRAAQFLVTNPTHFAVAIAYDPARAAAPMVLAKGRGDKAMAMRELAAELEVPSLEYPALARSLYYTTRERQVIREELYAAVASVLAFVLSLKRGEGAPPPQPQVEVPVTLRFDTEGRLDPGTWG